MNPLPIILLFLIKNSILVLGQHFLLTRHLLVPPIDGLGALSVPLEGGADGIDDAVNSAETLPLAGFLVAGDAPWDFPVIEKEAGQLCWGFGGGRNSSIFAGWFGEE